MRNVISAVHWSRLMDDGLPWEIVYGKWSGVDLVGTAAIFCPSGCVSYLSVGIKSRPRVVGRSMIYFRLEYVSFRLQGEGRTWPSFCSSNPNSEFR